MAKLIAGGVNSSQIKGKLGNQVFSRTNRETVIRAYQPIVRNPRTPAQVRQRRKFVAIQNGVRNLYATSFKPYGIKLDGHSAYTSISRMIHNNLVVKSIGYPRNYLPNIPKNYQHLLAYNTDLDGELFKYITIRVLKQGNNTTISLGCSVPKDEHPEIAIGISGQKYIGSNIAFSSMLAYVSCLGTRYTKMRLFESDSLDLLVNESGVSGNTIMGATADEISMNYKYVYKTSVVVIQDPQIQDNVFVTFGATDSLLADFGASSFADISVECAWPGVTPSGKCGFTIFTISNGVESDNLGEINYEENTSVYNRYCISAVNDWSEEYTIGG